ncbi:hypothetical protein Tco_0666658 [Tanacetum coccineum]
MTSPTRGGGPEGQDGREGTPPLTKEQIEGHISAMKSIIKYHNKRNKANPIRLNFEIEDQDPNEDRIVKGKEMMWKRFKGMWDRRIANKKKCDEFWWIDTEISSHWAQDQLERLQIEHDGLVSKFEQSIKSCKFMKIMIACMVQEKECVLSVQEDWTQNGL